MGAVMLDGYTYRTAKFHFYRYFTRIFRLESWRVLIFDIVIRRGLERLFGSRAPKEKQLGFVIDVPPREVAEANLQDLLARGVRLLFVYTHAVYKTYNHDKQFYGMFPSIEPTGATQVEFWPDSDHVFSMIEHQERLIRTVTSWAEEHFSPEAKQAEPTPSADSALVG